MKIQLITAAVLIIVSCNQSHKTDELRSQTIIDSVNAVNLANEVKQHTIDSMQQVNQAHSTTTNNTYNQTTTSSGNSTTPAAKKGMSNRTKGALIGAGAGIVTGAVTGAATSKDKGKGAVVGGVIGGAVGSGVGYGIGAHKDRKDTVR